MYCTTLCLASHTDKQAPGDTYRYAVPIVSVKKNITFLTGRRGPVWEELFCCFIYLTELKQQALLFQFGG
jgi:hypothetical protein